MGSDGFTPGGRKLPWLIGGRRIRPFAFGVSCATLVMAWSLLWKGVDDAGLVFHDGSVEGLLVGLTAAIATFLLWLAFFLVSTPLLKHGLLMAAGVFAARAAFLFLDSGISLTSAWISVCTVIMAAGAYLLEVATPEPHVGDDDG